MPASPTTRETPGVVNDTSAIGFKVGASFTGLTVTTKLTLVVASLPSVTLTVMRERPNRLESGVTVTVRLFPPPPNWTLPAGISVVLDDVAESSRLAAGVKSSPTVKASGPVEVSSSIVWAAIVETTGGLFGALTVSRKPVLVEPPLPSVTVSVMVAEPERLARGVTTIARLVPLPPREMLLSGTSDGSDDEAVTVSRAAGVSTSLTLNGRTGVEVFSLMD